VGLRRFIDHWIARHFQQGGKLERHRVIYEMFDTMLYSPGTTTTASPHVRDGIDLKRVMMTVWFAALPALLFGLYNTGYQANLQITESGYQPIPGWRTAVVATLTGFDPADLWANVLHGAVYYVPIFIVAYVAGFFWEVLFAWVRGHPVNEGFMVTGLLFTLILPPTIPLWQVFLGMSFGVVIGKEVFGGTGKNFLNPALVGRAFVFFAWPAQNSGDSVWTAVDSFSGATPLALAAAGNLDYSVGLTQNAVTGNAVELSWMHTSLGGIQGSIGETSLVAIAIGAIVLLVTRIASGRIMLSMFLGMAFMAALFNLIGSPSNPMFAMPWYWHLALGGFAFGMVFNATDPVTAAMTDTGKLIYGALLGIMTVLIRVVNPAFPEGVMLAILFGNLCAPLIDYFVMQANIRRRMRRQRGVRDGGT
jgi:Na+-transporting NADH:ubiquinone oxidoreductase subunit B